MTHHLLIRVYYEDTDVGGIVYHSKYLNYFERARTEALREQGFDLVSLYSNYGLHFVVHSAKIDYLRPARLDQLLTVKTRPEELRSASILYDQKIFLQEEVGLLLCQAKIRIACVDKHFRPCGLPKPLSRRLKDDN